MASASSGGLRPLACTGCGTNLPVADTRTSAAGGGELTCDECGEVHVHEHPPPARLNDALTVGQPVLLEWGGRWWPATVVAPRGPRRWRVHLESWAEAWDREVGLDELRPRPAPPQTNASDNGFVGIMLGVTLATGIALAIVIVALGLVIGARRGGESPQPSTIATTPAPSADSSVGKTVQTTPGPIANPSQLRVGPDTPLAVGQALHVRWRGDWYRARVAGLNDDGSVSVDYLGWPDRFDQAQVTRGRIRLVAGARNHQNNNN